MQTTAFGTKEQELQTYICDLIDFLDAETCTEIPETKNQRIQTPNPQLLAKDVEVHDEVWLGGRGRRRKRESRRRR